MVKLSAQLPQARLTRTQRVIGKRQTQLETARRKKEFEELRERAEQIQQTKFSNLKNLNEYEKQYQTLSSEMKQFFTTPQQMRIEQTARIQSNIPKVQERIKYAQQQNQKNETDFIKEMNEARQIDDSKSRKSEKRSVSNEYKEERKYWRAYLSGLNEGLGKLKGGQDLSYNSIEDFADDKGDFEEGQEKAENRQEDRSRKAFTKLLETSPYKRAIQKHETEFRGKTDWSNDASWRAVAKGEYVRQFGGVVAQQIASGKEGRISEVYKGIVGDTAFKEVSESIKAWKEEQPDTSLALEYTAPKPPPTPTVIDVYKEPTKSYIGSFAERIGTGRGVVQSGSDWLKRTLGLDKDEVEPRPFSPKYETVYTQPLDIDDAEIVGIPKQTEETKLYTGEKAKFDIESDKLSEEIFADYESQIDALGEGELKQEKIDEIKLAKQEDFNKEMGLLVKGFETDYSSKEQKRKDDAFIKKWGGGGTLSRGLGFIASSYFKQKEKDASRKGTAPYLFGGKDSIYARGQQRYELYRQYKLPKWLASEVTDTQEISEGIIQGTYKAVYENPRTFLIKIGAWASITGTAIVVGSYVPLVSSLATKPAVTWATRGLTALYGGSIAVRIATTTGTYERGLKAGQIIGEELLPLGYGGIVGKAVGTKTVGVLDDIVTLRKKPKWISPYKRVRFKVLTGEEKFPTAPTKQHLKEFRKQTFSLLPDEKKLLKPLHLGVHATPSGRFPDIFRVSAGTSELPFQYFGSEASLHFALGKGSSSSLYGGSIFGAKAPRPFVEIVRARRITAIPKSYKPKLTKQQVIDHLKLTAPDYPLTYITRAKGSYYRETAYLIERGRTAELIAPLRKSEIESGLVYDTVTQKLNLKPYYTRVAKPDFYKALDKITRKGMTEYVSKVKVVELKDILKPKMLLEKSWSRVVPRINAQGDIVFGRKIGQFKPMKKGRLVPIERYQAIPDSMLISEMKVVEVKDLLKDMNILKWNKKAQLGGVIQRNKRRVGVKSINLENKRLKTKIKELIDMPTEYSSSGGLKGSSITYGEQYGAMLLSLPKSSRKSIKTSFKSSHSPSSSSLKSSIKSLLYGSSVGSSSKSVSSSMSSISRAISSSLSASLSWGSGSPSASFSGSYSPNISTTKTPAPPLILFGKKKPKKKSRKKKGIYEELYIPDFTARALGLGAVSISEAQARKQLKKLITGLEIRRAVKVRRRR